MADTPLLLTMMARVNYDKRPARQPGHALREYVNKLLYEWEKKQAGRQRQETDLEKLLKEAGLAIDDLNRVLNKLAYDVHGQKGGRDTVDIPRQQLRDAFEALYLTKHQGQEAKPPPGRSRVLQFIDARSGLLQATEMGKLYYFAHRTFQEYLAARWMASSDAMQRIKQKIDDPNWREVVLLALGYQIFKLEAAGQRAAGLARTHARRGHHRSRAPRTLAAGRGLRAAVGTLSRAPIGAREGRQRGHGRHAGAAAPGHAAHRAGRSSRRREGPGPPAPGRRPAAGRPEPRNAGHGRLRAHPRRRLRHRPLPGDQPRVPRFMDAGGYDQDKPWWSEKAQEELPQYWGSWPTTPRYWDDSRFNHSTQPVVGISWYEANAYCAWLTGELQTDGQDVEVRLPTLEEWQQVAGSERYPWGKDFDPSLR